ncbi:MAG: hypothetical protein KF784_02325 [Fimbriimonadaceae bacterium]|nr:hypothetical protein [Fimbriimonadaceae bacterium]
METMLLRWGMVKRVRAVTGDDTALPKSSDMEIFGNAPGASFSGRETLKALALDAAEIDSEIRSAKAPMLEKMLWAKYVYGWEEVELTEDAVMPKSGETLQISTGRSTYRFTFELDRWARDLAFDEMSQVSASFGVPNWYFADRALRFFQWRLARSKSWKCFEKKPL